MAVKKTTDPSAPKKSTRTKKPVVAASESPASPQPTLVSPSQDEQIRQRAYEIYQQRGGSGGTAEEDWLRAEMEIRGKRTA